MEANLGWVPVAAYACVLFALSSTPDLHFVSEPVLDTVLRKLGHAAAYGLLAILVAYALRRFDVKRRWLFTMVLVIAYAITDEVHQAFVPGRVSSPVDLLIDALGGVVGLGIVGFLEAGDR